MADFNSKAMRKVVYRDKYLLFVYKDLIKRNEDLSEEGILEIVFNSNIPGDSYYEMIYQEELKGI